MTEKLLLPPNLASLAKVTSRENVSHVMSAIRVKKTGGGYQAEATDGRVLARVDGKAVPRDDEYPHLPALDAAPGGAAEALVDRETWAEAFSLPPRKAKYKSVLENVACVLGEQVVTFGGTNIDRQRTVQARQVDGKWPRTDEVLPKGKPAATIRVSALQLAELLRVAAEFTAGGEHPVTVELRGVNQPLVVRAMRDGQEFTGLLMPLV